MRTFLGLVLLGLASVVAAEKLDADTITQKLDADHHGMISQEASGKSINGKWSGAGHQTPVGASGLANYLIVMTINGSSGSIDYPALHCGGTVTRIGGSESSAIFREHITHGQCTDGGTITVNLRNGELAWTWVGSSGNVLAVMTRSR